MVDADNPRQELTMRRPTVSPEGTPTIRQRVPCLTATLLALLTAAAVSGCATSTKTAGAGGATATTTAATSASTVPATADGATTNDPAVLADGHHPVFLKTVDPNRRKITFDLVQFYTGQAAVKAAAEDHQESPPPNDYYIRNVNPKLRTLPVRAGAPITVNVLAAESTGSTTKDVSVTLAKLATWFPRTDTPTFWITVRHGQVTKIAEQFLP
jgi:hypothetical protein